MQENRSVWTAQKEGRTKDGNDATHKGVLKMLTLSDDSSDPFSYLGKIKLVPISISYEYDPTDVLKMPELLAKSRDEKYVKGENEDFLNLLRGIMGTKKRIHIQVNGIISEEIKKLACSELTMGEKLSQLASVIDQKIWSGYKLWPSNYIAHDLFYGDSEYVDQYTEAEKKAFEKRLIERVDPTNQLMVKNFLAMYANPVNNQKKALTELEPR